MIRHLLRRQLLLPRYLRQQRVRVRVMIGFLVRGRVRIKIRIRVRVRVGVTFNISVITGQLLLPEQMLYIPEGRYIIDSNYNICLDPSPHCAGKGSKDPGKAKPAGKHQPVRRGDKGRGGKTPRAKWDHLWPLAGWPRLGIRARKEKMLLLIL